MNDEPVFSPKEAAQRLRCSLVFLLSEIKKDKLAPVVRLNSRVIWIPESTLTAYVLSKTSKLAPS